MQKEITIQVLKRDFPMLVQPEEEPRVRKAAQMLQTRLEGYRQQYGVADDLYLALMCALDIANEFVALEDQANAQSNRLHSKLKELDQYLATALGAIQA
jgi:cell division protein ZapA